MTNQSPQWSNPNTSLSVNCSICLKSGGSVLSPCGGCGFRAHQVCYDRWKGSSATGKCPVCARLLVRDPDADVTFRLGTRVVTDGQLVTVVGVTYHETSGRREYIVATSDGVMSNAWPSTLAHVPMCRVCGSGSGCTPLEFNPCGCRGSLVQFVHPGCVPHGGRVCGICGNRVASVSITAESTGQLSVWKRFKGAFGIVGHIHT